jgi:hypothetical protein
VNAGRAAAPGSAEQRKIRAPPMISRRIAEHVKAHNWFAVAIDFVIVVVGVFVGIQVSNWNAARIDQAKAHAYLERIRADLDADLAGYQDRLSFWGKVSAYGAKGLGYAETGEAGDQSQWDLLLAYFQASQVAEFFTTHTTYDELKSGGALGLISDLELRDGLAQYYTNAGNPALTERPAYRMHVRGVIPLPVQAYIWASCYRSHPSGRQQLVDCESPIDEQRAARIVDAIRSDAALMAELRYWMSTMDVASRIGRDRTENAVHLRSLVEAELGGEPRASAP